MDRIGRVIGAMGGLLAFVLIWPASVAAQSFSSSMGQISVAPIVRGLDSPWGLAFLPDGAFLVTEQEGRLLYFDGCGGQIDVRGVPRVADDGQGGLLDVMVPRNFAQTREIFLTFSKPQGRGAGTSLAKARLSSDGARLSGVEVIFELKRGSGGGRHFGSRVVEGTDGFLYLTIGDRGDRPSAQDLSRENGSVVRVARDGRIPSSNPFVGREGAQPGIYSLGHRNPQGAALDRTGQLWVVEHGARGGDEINQVKKGANYGWPVIAYGRHYSGGKIGEGTAKQGLEQPEFYWDPSMAPSGYMIYGTNSAGNMFADWRGDHFVGSLKFDYIARLTTGGAMREVEQLKSGATNRVRDIREAPDGSIWFISAGNGTIYRMSR